MLSSTASAASAAIASSPNYLVEQHRKATRNTTIGPTPEQLLKIDVILNQAFKGLNTVFHLIPQEVHDQKNSFNGADFPGSLSSKSSEMFELFKTLTPSLEKTLEKGRLMAVAFDQERANSDFLERIQKGSYIPPAPDKLREFFPKVVKQFHANLTSLNKGEFVILPSGTNRHAIAYVVKRENNDLFTFSIVNTGLGAGVLGNIVVDDSGDTKVKDGEAPTFSNIPLELLLDSPLIDHILRMVYETMARDSNNLVEYAANFKGSLTRFYNSIRRLFHGYPEQKIPHFMQTQGQGTCGATCLHAALETFSPKGTVMYNLTYAKKELEWINRVLSRVISDLDSFKTSEKINSIIQKANQILVGANKLQKNLKDDPKYSDVWKKIDTSIPIPGTKVSSWKSTTVFPLLETVYISGSPLQELSSNIMSPAGIEPASSASEANTLSIELREQKAHQF